MTLWYIAIAEPLVACQLPVVEEAAEKPRQISTDDLIITWSEKNDELRGYSIKRGTWDVLKIEPQEAIAPTGVSNLAVVRLGTSIAAFSAEKGWWDVIELPDATKVNVEIKNDRLVLVQTNEHLYAFVAEKGLWTSPTDPELKASQESVAPLKINGGEIEAFEAWRMTLPLYQQRGISLIVSDGGVVVQTERQSWMKETREKIAEIWGKADPLVKEPSTNSAGRTAEEIESQIAKLRADFSSLELAVQSGAGSGSPLAADKENQARELRKLAEQSFDLRQQLHRREAERMRLKLQLIETNLSARERSREAIIARRVEALQSGTNQTSKSFLTNAAEPAAKGASISILGPPNLMKSEVAGVESQTVRGGTTDNANQRSGIDSRIAWPQPVEIVRELRGLRQSTTFYFGESETWKKAVVTFSQPLAKLIADGDLNSGSTEDHRQQVLESHQSSLDNVTESAAENQRDWGYAWSAYQAHLQLLRLDVQEAKSEADALAAQHERVAKLHSAGNVARERLDEVNVSYTAAKINLQRAEQVLKLYADIEANEPVLNPASVSPEWKSWTNAGNAASVPATPASVDPEPSQPPMDLTNTVPHSSSGPGNLVGSWNEVQEILTLLRTESDSFRRYQEVVEKLKKQIVEYGTPIDKWSAEDAALFKSSFLSKATRVPTRFDDDVWRLLPEKRQVYVEEGLLVSVPNTQGRALQFAEVSPSSLERIQRDLVARAERVLKDLGHETTMKKHEQAWKETWNAYKNRRQLLELDVQEQKTRLEDARQLQEIAQARQARGSDSTAPESAVRLAEIQLQRAEATLKPYMDIETQYPELNPDFVAPEKPQPESAEKP